MFDTLARTVPKDGDYPARTWRLDVLGRVLDGTIYDGLQHEFHDEKSDGGEYIPLRKRRPSVRYNLCRLVVEDSIALLFGEGHFPTVDLADPKDRGVLAEIIKESRLPQVMASASLIGSTGSVAILMRVLRGRVFFCEMGTGFLTPTYDPEAPDTLASVTERYKVRGSILAAQGYAIPLDAQDADWWFQRVWDTATESWYLPQSLSDSAAGKQPELDAERTVRHGLGFVPMVWIRNLPGGDDVDGACTFRSAIDTQVEIEYQLSQAGRGLKYSSDPLLLIKEPATSDDQIVRSAGNALVVSEKGDAKMLEIGGTAADAVISYVRALREMALESVHGNRSSADKLSAAQSGRALELMHQPLIWLADQLRTSYGENGVLPLARMVIEASRKMRLKVKGKDIAPFSDDADPTLRWPGWFAPTVSDQEQQATALSTSRRAGHISRETAVKSIAATYDIEDVDAELQRIQADDDAEDARVARNAAKTTAVEPLSD